MDPIPPATFYGNLMSTPGSDAMIDPMLLGNTTNVSRPPSTAVSAPPVAPPLRSTLESTDSTARKGCEEFSLKDLEQLLRAVIDINPYMAPHNKISEWWKQVERLQFALHWEGSWDMVKDTHEEEREQAKEGEKASQAAGESLRLRMMTGHRGHTKRARRPASSNSDSGKENHPRLSPSTPESGSVGSKQMRLTSLSHANTSEEIAKMV
ncbi:hypothetical protein JB92DRAFT_3134893 [Gautieria morchelliformis]|nr:hypothetical protein JB92DRAFT_3134893 [Gautieria morchelliformis]